MNYSLVGLTPEQAEQRDRRSRARVEGIPSVDADIDACNKLDDDERADLLGGPRQEADGGGRSVGAVPRCANVDIIRTRHEVRVRPVRRRGSLVAARSRRVAAEVTTLVGTRRAAPIRGGPPDRVRIPRRSEVHARRTEERWGAT